MVLTLMGVPSTKWSSLYSAITMNGRHVNNDTHHMHITMRHMRLYGGGGGGGVGVEVEWWGEKGRGSVVGWVV